MVIPVPWWILATLLILHAAAARAGEAPRLNAAGFTPSHVCGACHQDIYAMWKDSKHARAFDNPIFASAYREVRRGGDDARKLCLRCHAPIAGITGDLDLRQGVTREGVSCDFCHSVTGVAIRDAHSPFDVEVGAIKRSAKVGGKSPAHDIRPSILHKSARLCGGCHEFRNGEGVTTISTFSEWRASPYPAELKACQDCHFAPVGGRAAIQSQASPGSTVPDHRLQRSPEQLREAVRLEALQVTREEGRVVARVTLRNARSGHAVPTGHPSRRLALRVEARAAPGGALLGEAARTYQKLLLDAGGHPLVRDSDFLRAQKVSDNRLAPRESRTETFGFPAPAGEAVHVRAEVEYLYRSLVLPGNEWRVQVARRETTLPAR